MFNRTCLPLKKAPVMPDLVRHLGEKVAKIPGSIHTDCPRMTEKKAAEIPHQVRDDFEGLCGMTF